MTTEKHDRLSGIDYVTKRIDDHITNTATPKFVLLDGHMVSESEHLPEIVRKDLEMLTGTDVCLDGSGDGVVSSTPGDE